MNFPLPESRIANYPSIASYLPAITCQICHSLTLQQIVCLNCHENICFKCLLIGEDSIPKPTDIPLQTILITKTTKYLSNQNYRAICPICEVTTILSTSLPKMFHKLYTKVKFQCINRVSGCPEELCYPDLRIHEQKCGFNLMVCPKKECQQETYRKDYLNHISLCDPDIQCICGTTFKNSSDHSEQTCLRNQCETLKSQLFIKNELSYSSPQKQKRQTQGTSPLTTSPFSLQGLLQKSAQIMNENY